MAVVLNRSSRERLQLPQGFRELVTCSQSPQGSQDRSELLPAEYAENAREHLSGEVMGTGQGKDTQSGT